YDLCCKIKRFIEQRTVYSSSPLIELYHKLLYNSTLCGAKLPFLFSFLSYLLSGNDNFREERRTNREK
ncbi:MAG: hypothetical protein IJD22_06540, partial [Clostridia bacterium]|nr:hypothetical protein [Clostridia bacterium]